MLFALTLWVSSAFAWDRGLETAVTVGGVFGGEIAGLLAFGSATSIFGMEGDALAPFAVAVTGAGGVGGAALAQRLRGSNHSNGVLIATAATAGAATLAAGTAAVLADSYPQTPEASSVAGISSGVLLVLGVPFAAGLAIANADRPIEANTTADESQQPWVLHVGGRGVGLHHRF